VTPSDSTTRVHWTFELMLEVGEEADAVAEQDGNEVYVELVE
jgi:hypothetical protein